MNAKNVFPSRFLRADDLQGATPVVTIKEITMEEFKNQSGQQETKPCMTLVGKDKAVTLNKTNFETLRGLFGDETDEWVGQKVRLCSMPVPFQGKVVPAIRILAVAGNAASIASKKKTSSVVQREPGEDSADAEADDVSF